MYRISFAGSGNLAFHLANAFAAAGHQIDTIFGRNERLGKNMADRFRARFTTSIQDLDTNADFIFICTPDDVVASISQQLKYVRTNIIHCSGILPLSLLKENHYRGVFYPVQSFSKNRELDFQNIPVCIESDEPAVEAQLEALAQTVSGKVHFYSSEQRKWIHLAAVFANNFTNHLIAEAERLLEEHNIPVAVLHEILRETAAKAIDAGAAHSQTGPAKRNDIGTMNQHLQMLDENKREIYRLISDEIRKSAE